MISYFSKYISICLINPFRTYKKLKGVFKPLRANIFFGNTYEAPLIFFNSRTSIVIESSDVLWKDKYDTPRFEEHPYIHIKLFNYSFVIFWKPEYIDRVDDYWEQALWYLYYYSNISYGCLDAPNIDKAKESWPWTDMNNKSTWSDKYLIK